MAGMFGIISSLITGACLEVSSTVFVVVLSTQCPQASYLWGWHSKNDVLGLKETSAGVFDSSWFWRRISQKGIGVFDFAATGYDTLARHFNKHIAILAPAPAQKEIYIHAMIAVRIGDISC